MKSSAEKFAARYTELWTELKEAERDGLDEIYLKKIHDRLCKTWDLWKLNARKEAKGE